MSEHAYEQWAQGEKSQADSLPPHRAQFHDPKVVMSDLEESDTQTKEPPCAPYSIFNQQQGALALVGKFSQFFTSNFPISGSFYHLIKGKQTNK